MLDVVDDADAGVFLTTAALARRWRMSSRSLERWRRQQRGLPFIRLPGKILYRLNDVVTYEESRLRDGWSGGK